MQMRKLTEAEMSLNDLILKYNKGNLSKEATVAFLTQHGNLAAANFNLNQNRIPGANPENCYKRYRIDLELLPDEGAFLTKIINALRHIRNPQFTSARCSVYTSSGQCYIESAYFTSGSQNTPDGNSILTVINNNTVSNKWYQTKKHWQKQLGDAEARALAYVSEQNIQQAHCIYIYATKAPCESCQALAREYVRSYGNLPNRPRIYLLWDAESESASNSNGTGITYGINGIAKSQLINAYIWLYE